MYVLYLLVRIKNVYIVLFHYKNVCLESFSGFGNRQLKRSELWRACLAHFLKKEIKVTKYEKRASCQLLCVLYNNVTLPLTLLIQQQMEAFFWTLDVPLHETSVSSCRGG